MIMIDALIFSAKQYLFFCHYLVIFETRILDFSSGKIIVWATGLDFRYLMNNYVSYTNI